MADYNNSLPTIQRLLEELKDVDNWILFGAFLGVPVNQLRKTESTHHGEIERCKTDMLRYWLENNVNASWKDVVRALEQTNQLVLAVTVKQKYLLSDTAADQGSIEQVEVNASSSALPSTPLPPPPPATKIIEIKAGIAVVEELQGLEHFYSHTLVKVTHFLNTKCDLSEAQLFLDTFTNTDEFSRCDNFDKLIRQLEQYYIDIFHIFLLQQLVAYFDKDELTELVESYKEKKNSFLKSTTVVDFQHAVVSRVKPDLHIAKAYVTIRIPKKMASHRTLVDIEMLAMEGFEECYRSLIQLHVVPGSIIDAGEEEVTAGGSRVYPVTQQKEPHLLTVPKEKMAGVKQLQTMAGQMTARLSELPQGDEHTQIVSASATSATKQEADSVPPLDADTAHEAFEQEVDLSVSNLVVCGSPGSGKTCTVYLLVNEPAPTVRHSTGCVEKPVRAIAHAAICISGTKLQKLETKEMLRMVCQTIKYKIQQIHKRKRAEARCHREARTPDSSTSSGKQQIRKPSNVSSPQEPPTPSSASPSQQDTTSPEAPTLTQGEEEDDDEDEEEDEDEEDEEENIQVFAKLLNKISAVEASTDFLTARLVSTVDSGGQPHFMDAARLFLRNNSLYLLTIKLNEPLDAKPKFDFYIDGVPISMCNTDLQLTNLQLVESLAMNVSSLQLTTPNTAEAGSEPQQAKFLIVGTFADRAGECQGETIADKNKKLRERLKDFKAERVEVGGDVIFAINAIADDPEERLQTALKLQEKITETPGITIKTKVKLRWFGLLLHMLDEAEKRKVPVLHLDEVIDAGKCLKMSKEETMEAIKYFHELNLIMHYRTTKLEHIVFVDVKPPLDKVSSLIGVAFIDRLILDKLFKPNLSTDAQESLRDYGRFSQHILNSFSFSFPFTANVFLDLLEHLCIIARIEKSGQTVFFLPCALPYAPDNVLREKEQAYRNPWILRLKMRRNIVSVTVPTPKGYLPTLVVSLLNSPEFETDDSSLQYRNLMSLCYDHTRGGEVYFIEKNHQLEIYYSWENEYYQHCSVIRSKILEVLVEVEKQLQFRPDILVKEDVFICSCNGPDPRHFCTFVSKIKKVVCEKTRKPLKLTHKQKLWFDEQAAEAVGGEPHKSEPSPQPSSTASPSSPISSQGQATKPAPQAQPQVSSTTGATPAVLSPAIMARSEEWSNVSDALLEKDDIAELCAVLTPIEAKWDCFGTQLGILPDTTNAIGRKNHYVPALCLKDVLNTWLNGGYNIAIHGHQSWRRVCEATASPAGGENKRLAQEIAAQHCQSKPKQTAIPKRRIGTEDGDNVVSNGSDKNWGILKFALLFGFAVLAVVLAFIFQQYWN